MDNPTKHPTLHNQDKWCESPSGHAFSSYFASQKFKISFIHTNHGAPMVTLAQTSHMVTIITNFKDLLGHSPLIRFLDNIHRWLFFTKLANVSFSILLAKIGLKSSMNTDPRDALAWSLNISQARIAPVQRPSLRLPSFLHPCITEHPRNQCLKCRDFTRPLIC